MFVYILSEEQAATISLIILVAIGIAFLVYTIEDLKQKRRRNRNRWRD